MSNEDFLTLLNSNGIHTLFPINATIYKYVTIETAQKIILTSTLKFSKVSEFNDPFELTSDFIDFTCKKSEIRDLIKKYTGFSNNAKKQLVKDKRNLNLEIAHFLNNQIEKMKSEIGISCFSKSFNKSLMWSHYADKHQGVCLGFSMPPYNKHSYFLLCVNYLEDFKSLNYFKHKEIALFFWLVTKSIDWSYEEEVRAIFTDKSGLIKFDKTMLKEIYFGLRTTEINKESIVSMLEENSYNNLKKYQMFRSPSKFSLFHSSI